MRPGSGHVVIRCDASPAGGVGHLVRAISVAGVARAAGWTVALAGEISSDLARALVTAQRLDVVEARADLGVLAAEQGATVVHVDHYDVGADAWQQVAAAGALLSSMEDGLFGRRRADVVVDSTIRAEQLGRPDDGSGTTLLGIGYAPMRAEVVEARTRRAATYDGPGDAVDLLVVMGGTDATGAAATAAGVCRAARGVGRVTVIAPADRWQAVRAAAGDDVELLVPGPEFLERAAAADLVVSAAGTTSWELACLGVPSVLVAVVENQRAGYEAALAEGVARGLGSIDEVRADPAAAVARLEDAVVALQEGRSWGEAGLVAVDGRGAERIVDAWAAALDARAGRPEAPMVARPATADDALLLLRWRNDPLTRAVSRNTAAVSWAAHGGWFARLLGDAERALFVAERDGVPLGTVRFDAHGEEWEVSITLAPEARGKGLAGVVLAAGQDAFFASRGTARLVAAVLPDNAASQRLFLRAGYVPDPARRDGDFHLLVRT